MGFSGKQAQALRRNLDNRHVRMREANGRELFYIEGWYAISEANRIFGFDGWNRETVESRCVLMRENRGTFLAVYVAHVRITVHAAGTTVIREGHGTGEGRGTSPAEVHDVALKTAETDATKRALATFGRHFGLELYRNRKAPLSGAAPPSPPKNLIRRHASDFIRTIQRRFLDLLVTIDIGKIRSFNTLATKIAAPITRQRIPNGFCLSRPFCRQLRSIKVF